MKKIIGFLTVAAVMCAAIPSFAQSAFCAGFAEGYKSIKGEMVILPICPLEPITPIGSTPFREGLKAGIIAASK